MNRSPIKARQQTRPQPGNAEELVMNRHPIQTRQRGFALAISLILLTVITMLSLTAMRSANLDTKIAINHQHKRFAYQAAENALSYLISMPTEEIRVLNEPQLIGDYDNGINVGSTPAFIPYDTGSHSSADLDMTLLDDNSTVHFYSGHEMGAPSLIFQADAIGNVANTNATVHNRMEVSLIRDRD